MPDHLTFKGIVRVSACFLVCLAVAACQSTSGNSPGSSEPQGATAQAGPGEAQGAEKPAEAVSKVETSPPPEKSQPSAVVTTSSEAPEQGIKLSIIPSPLPPSAKRTAAGLPDPIPAYLSWLRLGPIAVKAGQETPHLPLCQVFVSLPGVEDVEIGKPLRAQLPEGTVVVLEAMKPGSDFIEEVSTMLKEKEGWKYFSYSRSTSESPFSPGKSEGCADCHGKAPADSIFSTLVPR